MTIKISDSTISGKTLSADCSGISDEPIQALEEVNGAVETSKLCIIPDDCQLTADSIGHRFSQVGIRPLRSVDAAFKQGSTIPAKAAHKIPMSRHELVKRLGRNTLHMLCSLAGTDPESIETLSLSKLYKRAGKRLFGSSRNKKASYWHFKEKLGEKYGEEFNKMMASLSGEALHRFRKGKLRPKDIFTFQAIEWASWRHASEDRMTYREMRRNLTAEGRGHDLEKFEMYRQARLLTGSEERELSAGKMSPVQFMELVGEACTKFPDYIILGGGSSGFMAAAKLRRKGYHVLVLEAQAALGGRTSFHNVVKVDGFEVGTGAMWTGGWFGKKIKELGIPVARDNTEFRMYVRGKYSERATKALLRNSDRVEEIIEKAAEKHGDISVRAALHKKFGKKIPDGILLAAQNMLREDYGASLDQISVSAWNEQIDSEKMGLPITGYHSAIKAFTHGVPTLLNHPVSEIDWSKVPVCVQANGKKFYAQAVASTCSTAAMQRIKFEPDLPAGLRQALRDLRMCCYEKVILPFAEKYSLFDTDKAATVFHVQNNQIGLDFEINFGGRKNLVVGFFGGLLQEGLNGKGERERIEIALKELGKIFPRAAKLMARVQRETNGSAALWREGTQPHATSHANNVRIDGGWAIRAVGAEGARKTYRTPRKKRLYPSGEAASQIAPGTVNGATMSGKRTANQLIKDHPEIAANKVRLTTE